MKEKVSFEEFYKANIIRLTKYIAIRLNGDYHLAEEIADDVMYRMDQNYDSVMKIKDEAIWSYLTTTADRCISDTMKYLKRGKRSPEKLISLDTLISESYLDMVSQEEWIDGWIDIQFAIKQLTPIEKQALLLWSSGIPIKQISSITGISYGQAITVIKRAKKKLKLIILNGGEQSE